MRGGDLAEDIGVIEEGAEMIDTLHHRHARRRQGHGGIVGLGHADRNIRARRPGQPGQRLGQRRRPDLGAAAAAAHRLTLCHWRQ